MLNKRFEWTKETEALIGTAPDAEIALRLGVSKAMVCFRRLALGQAINRPRVAWTEESVALLGSASDVALAERLGISVAQIKYKRAKLDIPAFFLNAAKQPPFVWTESSIALLGKYSDKQAAQRLGTSSSVVRNKRQDLGIQAARFNLGIDDSLLGTLPDRAYARILKIHAVSVAARREALGIPVFSYDFIWTDDLIARLGRDTDAAIGEDLGICSQVVRRKRLKLGIQSAPRPNWVVWTENLVKLLGTMPDRDMALLAGCSRNYVAAKRSELGIISFRESVQVHPQRT